MIEVYETWHNPEKFEAVSVIEKEINRCEDLIDMLTGNDELITALKDRIEVLEHQKDSITSDIQNGFLSPAAYLEKLKNYLRSEKANFMAARDDGVDKENLGLIMTRLEQISAEIKEMEQGMQGESAESTGAAGGEPGVTASGSVPPGQYDPKVGALLDEL